MIADRAPPGPRPKIDSEAIDPTSPRDSLRDSLQDTIYIDLVSRQKIGAVAARQERGAERADAGGPSAAAAGQRGQPAGGRRALNETRIAIARNLMQKGMSKSAIARVLKVSRTTVILALLPYAGEAPKKLPITIEPPPPVPPHAIIESNIGLARRMLAAGVTEKIIAQALKVPLSTVRLALEPYAAEAPPRRAQSRVRGCAMTDSKIDLARRMVAARVTKKMIAQALKVSYPTLYLALKPYGTGPFSGMGRRRATRIVNGVTRPMGHGNEASAPALGDEQALKLLDAPPADTLKGVRDRAIMATLHYHDIRREELCGLRVKDLFSRQGVMHFCIKDKQGGIRFVPVNADAQRRIDDYLILAGHKDDAEGALFRPIRNNLTKRLDRPLDPGSISKNVVRKYRRKTGITAEVHGLCVFYPERDSAPPPEPNEPTEPRE